MSAPDEPAPPLTLCLFGPFDVRVNGAPLPRLRSRKGHWLLALLALRQGRQVEREWLVGTLWPDDANPQAGASLRNSLADLRRALGPEAGRLRSPTPRTLCLDVAGAEIDVLAFDQAIAEGQERSDARWASLERAVSLYRGPLLEGWAEPWAFQERQAREQACLTALERLAGQALALGDATIAERHLRRAVAVDPLRETAQRALMQTLATAGDYAAALQTYRELRLLLHREINAEPDAETAALYQQLRAEARQKAETGDGRREFDTIKGFRTNVTLSNCRLPSPVSRLPSGTLTFLFTDIEGSTRLWELHPETMPAALARHDALLAEGIQSHGGVVVKSRGEGDSFFAVFARASDAVAAACALQLALLAEPWPLPSPLRVRTALHTGEAEQREDDYYGPVPNRCARLRAAAHGGQVLLSLATQELVRDALPAGASLKELGLCRLRDLQRPETVFQLLHPELPGEFPSLRSLDALPHNLPQQLTSFIGRQREMEEVKRLLGVADGRRKTESGRGDDLPSPDCRVPPTASRLVTLTGSGGCGKTRLSLEVAAEVLEEYADGVWLVELAALADPALAPQAVATALGVREEPGRRLLQILVDFLEGKRLLLILDNCEHLLAACAGLVEELLRSCPHLRVLASSREGLNIAGEQTYRVPSLSLPPVSAVGGREARYAPNARPLTPAALTQYEAVRLFIDRAVLHQPSFAVTNQNAPAVAQLCQRLDGIPLAIELAAARVKVLPVEQIAARLDDMFRLLTGGSRTALPRQQTLRALIDWSYNLLSSAERTLLQRLSMFAGGCTLEAAEAVCAGESIEAWEVLDLLIQLVEKSLVVHEPVEGAGDAEGAQWEPEPGRYRLLETVRQYARDRLLESGEGPTARDRHRDWFAVLAERAAPHTQFGAEHRTWLDRLEREHDNLRAALEWCETTEDGREAGVRLAGALTHFWVKRGHLEEGWQNTIRVLAAGSGASAASRGKALVGAMFMAFLRHDIPVLAALVEEGLALGQAAGDRWLTAASLFSSARASLDTGDLERAESLAAEALALGRELGDRWLMNNPTEVLAIAAANRGDYERAGALFQECLHLSRSLEDTGAIAPTLWNLGWVARLKGDDERARALYSEALALWRGVGDRNPGFISALQWFADLVLIQGDPGTARACYDESLAIAREVNDRPRMSSALLGLVRVARAQGEHEKEQALLHEGETAARAIENPADRMHPLAGLGHLARDLGDYQRAEELYRESLGLRREVGDTFAIAQSLEDLAVLAGRQQQWERAARLLGAAEAVCAGLGRTPPAAGPEDYKKIVTGARASLGEAAFDAAWAEGRAVPLQDAIEFALGAESS